MNFAELRAAIKNSIDLDFQVASSRLQTTIFGLDRADILPLVVEIGIIPEDIKHDSTEESYIPRCLTSFWPSRSVR